MDVWIRFQDRFRSPPPAYSQELLDEVDGDDYLKTASSSRSHTDVPFFVLQGIFLTVLMFFLGYCSIVGDVDRLTKGFDNCGNICGVKNDFLISPQMECHSEDMTRKPFLLINGYHRECVATCDSNTIIGYRCFGKNDVEGELSYTVQQDTKSFFNKLEEISRDLHTCSNEIIILCFMALGFGFTTLLVLRYLAGVFVWSVLIGIILISVAGTAYLWSLTDTTEAILPVAIISSIITIVIILVILIMRKRIELVIQLLKEAGKSITAMPLLLFEPLLTFLALAIAWSVWIYSTLLIESAGLPTEVNSGEVQYKQNAVIRFTRWYNLFIMLWMVQFIYGCQNMIIGGAVARWYFTRNKNRLDKPIYNSTFNMMKYHMGTVSCGSLIIALIQMIRILLRHLRRVFGCIKCCLRICCLHDYMDGCMLYLENLMKYLTNNAYIITSIHGLPFYESGTRAFKLLIENALRVIAINSVGDFVLILAKLLIVASTVASGVLMLQDKEHVKNIWAPLVLSALVAFLIAHCFITVYEMAIDTIFICFCEDCEINDGFSRPYFMPHGLMEFVNKSRAVLGIKLAEEVNPGVVISTEVIH